MTATLHPTLHYLTHTPECTWLEQLLLTAVQHSAIKYSFENKAVFHAKNYNRDTDDIEWEYSRGGGTHPSQCYYALLDWGQQSQSRRANCVVHRIIDANQRVAQGTIRDYFLNHPDAVNVANDVGWDLQNMEYVNPNIGNME